MDRSKALAMSRLTANASPLFSIYISGLLPERSHRGNNSMIYHYYLKGLVVFNSHIKRVDCEFPTTSCKFRLAITSHNLRLCNKITAENGLTLVQASFMVIKGLLVYGTCVVVILRYIFN